MQNGQDLASLNQKQAFMFVNDRQRCVYTKNNSKYTVDCSNIVQVIAGTGMNVLKISTWILKFYIFTVVKLLEFDMTLSI